MKVKDAINAVDRTLVDGIPVTSSKPLTHGVLLRTKDGDVYHLSEEELPLPDRDGWYWINTTEAGEIPIELQSCVTPSALSCKREYATVCMVN